MRGRRGESPSPVSQKQTRMALRKQILKDSSDISSESQQSDINTQEDEDLEDRDDNEDLSSSFLPSSSREKRKTKRENKSKPKEMTEEEMMDLALRLSEQEASVTAIRLQQEEEAMMKAIQESMVSQTQQSQSLLANANTALGSRRKLSYMNRKTVSGIDQGPAEVSKPEVDLKQGGAGDGSNNRNKKRKRKEGSPLLEMPDLSQASPCSSESLSVRLDSPQSSDSIQLIDCPLRKSPVFPSTGCRAEVLVPPLSPHLLDTCRASGFVLCSQDSWTLTRKTQSKSQTFSPSPKRSNENALPNSPVFSETYQGGDEETECPKSPVFGRNTQREASPSACKPQDSVCNSGFMFSSQESLTSSVKSASSRPESPTFPSSPGLPKNLPQRSATCQSPRSSETDEGPTAQSRGSCTSAVFCRTRRLRRKIHPEEQKPSTSPSAAELSGSEIEGNSTTSGDPPQSESKGSKTDSNKHGRLNNSSKSAGAEEELNDASKDCSSANTELTSDMTIIWSDDDTVTPVGSPSPVFPEERPVQQAERDESSWNHEAAASPENSCRLSTSSTSTVRQQLPTTHGESRPTSSLATASEASTPHGEPAVGPTVHYYWGVPFCPRGVDPDQYTQVILGHMDMYEKSLKQAQRCLLRKAEWGEAVLPQPEKSPSPDSPAESPRQHVPRRRGLRLGGTKRSERDKTSSAEGEEDGESQRDEEQRESKEDGKEEGEDGGQKEAEDCEVCPETPLSCNDEDRTQDLMMATDAGAQLEFNRKNSPEPAEVEMILRDDSPVGDERQAEEEEMEVDVDRQTSSNVADSSTDVRRQHVRKVEEDRRDPDVEEMEHRGCQRSRSPELEPAAVPLEPETSVDCPICQGSFPVTEIERHAAFCDGEVAVVDERRPERGRYQVSLKPRLKRTRRAETTDGGINEPSNSDKNLEKCYICLRSVPLRDFSRHTELCIQRQKSKTAAGNLLSALDQTESRDSEAGPSGSRLQPGDVIDLLDDDDEEEEGGGGGVSSVKLSNSPIRSFTPISELSGCLIDFKKQQQPRAKTLRQRRR